MKLVENISDYYDTQDNRVKDHCVTVLQEVSDSNFLALRKLCSAFFEEFENSLSLCPTPNEVFVNVMSEETEEQLKLQAHFVSGWFAAHQGK